MEKAILMICMTDFRSSSWLMAATVALSVACGVMAVSATDANATLMLRVSDGTVTKSISDEIAGLGGDNALGIPGLINFSGSVGGFAMNISTGSAKPVIGSATSPQLALATTNISSEFSGPFGPSHSRTLTIELTDTDFGPNNSPLKFMNLINSAYSGTGEVLYYAYIDDSNTAFGQGQLIKSLGPGSGDFDLSGKSKLFSLVGMYSMTLIATLTHTHSGPGIIHSQFDASVTALPEPGTLSLCAIGLLGLGRIWRRKARGINKAYY